MLTDSQRPHQERYAQKKAVPMRQLSVQATEASMVVISVKHQKGYAVNVHDAVLCLNRVTKLAQMKQSEKGTANCTHLHAGCNAHRTVCWQCASHPAASTVCSPPAGYRLLFSMTVVHQAAAKLHADAAAGHQRWGTLAAAAAEAAPQLPPGGGSRKDLLPEAPSSAHRLREADDHLHAEAELGAAAQQHCCQYIHTRNNPQNLKTL